jgi:hypothetical protein
MLYCNMITNMDSSPVKPHSLSAYSVTAGEMLDGERAHIGIDGHYGHLPDLGGTHRPLRDPDAREEQWVERPPCWRGGWAIRHCCLTLCPPFGGASCRRHVVRHFSNTTRLCAAIVDRWTFPGQIIETGSTSYRLAHARNARPAR